VFNLSGSELVFLVLIALVVLGPDKLPEAMRKAGKAYADFKKMTSGFQSEMRSVLDEPMRELRETAELAKKAASWDTNMLDPKADAAETKPVSASMADHTPAVPNPAAQNPATPVTPVTEAGSTNGDALPAADNPAAADATTRRLHAQATNAPPTAVVASGTMTGFSPAPAPAATTTEPTTATPTVAEAPPFSPNFSSAAPRITPPAADTDEAAAE
jgi:sec-independent protein translocase protein TatB